MNDRRMIYARGDHVQLFQSRIGCRPCARCYSISFWVLFFINFYFFIINLHPAHAPWQRTHAGINNTVITLSETSRIGIACVNRHLRVRGAKKRPPSNGRRRK